MGFQSILRVRVHAGQRGEAVGAFIARRVLEEAAAAVAGFLHGELLLPQDDPDELWISAAWQDEASCSQWLASPVRAAQGPDLVRWVSQAPTALVFECAHRVVR